MSRLYSIVCGDLPAPVGLDESICPSESLSETLTQLLDIGYLLGLSVQRLRKLSKVDSGKFMILFDMKSQFDPHVVMRENGRKFLAAVLTMLRSSPEECLSVIDALCDQRALAIPYRDYLLENREQIAQSDFVGRVALFHEIHSRMIKAVGEAGDSGFGDAYYG